MSARHVRPDGRDEWHVHPVRDLIRHELSGDCACGPAVEAVFRPDGSNGWLVTHHSLDGREKEEEDMTTPDPYQRWPWWMVLTFLAGLAYASIVGTIRRLVRAVR